MAILAPPALIFFCNSILFISLFTRLPSIQESLGVDKAILGLSLLGAPLGTFLALPVAGRITNALSPRRTAALMLALCALITPLMSATPFALFVVCFVAWGFCRTILDVAANMVATGIEQRTGRKVLARSHGFWSVGLLIGSLFSGFLAERDVTSFAQQSIAAVAVLIASFIILKVTPDHPMPASAEKGGRHIFILPTRPIILICIMIFGLSIVEGAIYDWGTFFIREHFGANPQTAAVLFSGFTIGMGLTRLIGDRLRELFQPAVLVRTSASAVAIGLLLMISASDLAWGAISLFMIGCGISLNAPLAISTAVHLPGQAPADNLAALSLSMLIATLGVPPLLGIVAQHYGLVASFAVLMPFVLLSLLMAPVSEGRLPWFALRRSA